MTVILADCFRGHHQKYTVDQRRTGRQRRRLSRPAPADSRRSDRTLDSMPR